MSYYQNPQDAEFQGSLLLSDRQFNMTFKIKGNSPNASTLSQAWNPAPYDLSTNNTLTLNYSFDAGNSWTTLAINIATGSLSTSAVTAYEVADHLNANSTFNALYVASVNLDNKGNVYPVIKSIRAREKFKSYISNTSAEIQLRFNKKAGVAEFPTYFDRHKIGGKANFPDSFNQLVALDVSVAADLLIIRDAGFSYDIGVTNGSATATTKNTYPFQVGDTVIVFDATASTILSTTISAVTTNTSLTLGTTWGGSTGTAKIIVVHADWQLLRGRSGIFTFKKNTVDVSNRITQTIEYPAGALPGDFARKINYSYDGSNTQPTKVTEIPYTLTSSDLIVP